MKGCSFVSALLSLIASIAFAQESYQPMPNGVVEEFMYPEKLHAEPAVAEEMPVVTQEPVPAVAESSEKETPVATQEPAPAEIIVEERVEIQFGTVEAEPLDCPSNCFIEDEPVEEYGSDFCFDHDSYCDPEKKWYFELKPGYFIFTDNDMRNFFSDGGFTMRGEVGCKFWRDLIVWVDGGYFQNSGKALGGTEKVEFKLATITLGLKYMYYYNSCVGFYAGAGPRLFMMMMHNDSPFVRGDDNEIGIGAGFDAGVWFFPVPQWPNLFFDLFGDYSWKNLEVEADEISSFDYDVDVSGFSFGLGIGVRF